MTLTQDPYPTPKVTRYKGIYIINKNSSLYICTTVQRRTRGLVLEWVLDDIVNKELYGLGNLLTQRNNLLRGQDESATSTRVGVRGTQLDGVRVDVLTVIGSSRLVAIKPIAGSACSLVQGG